MAPVNSNYLKWFKEIEKNLWGLFRLFEDLCARCAVKTLEQVDTGIRKKRASWCCCMIDNQVHDYWNSLNAIQVKFDAGWYESLKKQANAAGMMLKNRHMPGNGPCPGLGPKGCLIRQYRPMTCTTQLCEKMLFVLSQSGVTPKFKTAPLQIEDVLSLPDMLPILYGHRKGPNIKNEDVQAYLQAIRDLRERFGNIPVETRLELNRQAIHLFME